MSFHESLMSTACVWTDMKQENRQGNGQKNEHHMMRFSGQDPGNVGLRHKEFVIFRFSIMLVLLNSPLRFS